MALSYRTQHRLASLIQAIAEAEKKTEVVRQVLAEQRLFEPHTAFRRLDLSRDGYISNSELTEFLTLNSVVASSTEIVALFAGLDENEDGLISYNDFVSSILPQEDEKLKTLATLRESYHLQPGEPLPYEVEWGLIRVFEQEIKNYRNIENLKDILASSFDYNALDAFNTIDYDLLGFIDFESIDKFQRSANKILSEDEIHAFLRVVGDLGRVTYAQFSNAIGGGRQIANMSPSKLERVASPYKSRQQYQQELQDELNRSINRSRRLQLENELQQSQDRLQRSIVQQETLNRSIELQRERQNLERSIDLQRSRERLDRSIELEKSRQRLDRSIELQRSQDRLNKSIRDRELLERSIDLKRSQDRLERSINLQRSQDRVNRAERELERLRSQEKVKRIEQELERKRSIDRIDRLNRSIERQQALDRSIRENELERSIRQQELESSIRKQELERSIRKNELDRSIRQQELERSTQDLNRSLRQQELQRSQDRLNRSLEKSRQLEVEAEILRSQRLRQQEQEVLEDQLQRSLEKSRRIESQILDASLRVSQFESPSKRGIITQGSPMKGNEEQHLVQALKSQVNLDREIEEIKKQLSLKVDFNALDAFRIFDVNGRGYVTKLEVEQTLNGLGIYPTKDELYLFFKRFDTDSDGLLRYSEFNRIVLPSTLEYSSLMSNRTPHYLDNNKGIDIFEFETRYLLKKLLNKVLAGENEAERLRQTLSRRPLFSVTDAFNALDSHETGFISHDEFKSILNDWGFFVSNNDLQTLVSRYDRNNDGKVSYGEFLNEITPKSPVKQY